MTSRKVEDDALVVVGKSGEPLFRMRESFGLPRATVAVSGKITQEAVHDFVDELTSLALVSDNIAIDFTDTEFIAGGALMGVVSALLKFFNVDWFLTAWHSTYGEAIAIIPFLSIIGYMVVSSLRSERQ